MGNISVQVSHLIKAYSVYKKPIDRLKEMLLRRPRHTKFYSVNDVSFTLLQGDILGIIGSNGAGKSSILKMLAGTLDPSSGHIKMYGRVAALLELGAGFHPEFTGRENIYLNANLLGLDNETIKAKEQSIVDFSELKEFIDRPVKTYSSGMYVRLAFSIATSVDPDILIIDEALSVGDQSFRKKCIDRIISFKEQNKTIIFCSHDLFSINQLCQQVLWIEKGIVRQSGKPINVTTAYSNFVDAKESPIETDSQAVAKGEKGSQVKITRLLVNGSEDYSYIKYNEDLHISFSFRNPGGKAFWPAIGIKRKDEILCHAVNGQRDIKRKLDQEEGELHFTYYKLPFYSGEYIVTIILLDEHGLHVYDNKMSNTLTIKEPDSWENQMGFIDMNCSWIEAEQQE